MKEKTKVQLIMWCLVILGFGLLFYGSNWIVCLSVFCLLWANNIGQDTR